jgi:hypothetical protein
MPDQLRRAAFLSVAGLAIAALGAVASLAGFLIAGVLVTLPPSAGQVGFPSAHGTNGLLHPVLLKEHADGQRHMTAGDRRGIEHAVRMQLRAYAARDAEQAFARLSLSTQRLFGAPDRFLRSIAQDVPPMLDTRRFALLGLDQNGSVVVQQVLITDSSGREWLAEFQLEPDSAGAWRIKGCIVQATPGQQAHSSSSRSEPLA